MKRSGSGTLPCRFERLESMNLEKDRRKVSNLVVFWCTVIVLASLSSLGFPAWAVRSFLVGETNCERHLDCEFNGECRFGKCVCDKGWTGRFCSSLNLAPARLNNGYRKHNISSWGGNILNLSDAEKPSFHLFVSEIVGGCGLTSWGGNSKIIHAVSSQVDGPYEKVGDAVGVWAHNPQVILAPDGTFLLYHIGRGTNNTSPQECSEHQGTTPNAMRSSFSKTSIPKFTFPIHYSSSPQGPWALFEAEVSFDVGSNANPAPYMFPNGTVVIVFNAKDMALASATTWRGPYVFQRSHTCGAGEDPFLYADKRGNFHCLSHASPFNQPEKSILHSYSSDGIKWSVSEYVAAGSIVTFENDQKVFFSKRERPKVFFDTNGDLSHFISGVTINPPCAPDFLPELRLSSGMSFNCTNLQQQYDLADTNPHPGNYDRSTTLIQQLL